MKSMIPYCGCAHYAPAIIFFLLTFASQLQAQDNWKLQTEQNGIKVYTCRQNGSEFDAIWATFEAEATLSQYAATALNIDEYKYWNYAATNPYIVKRINDSELIYYTEAKAPWPVSDRYAVLHMKATQDPKSKILKITLNNMPDLIPQKDGFVRIAQYHAVITVTPVTESKVKVDYVLNVDPGGSIPVWVINLVSKKMPVNTFTNLKNRLKAQGKQKPSLSFVSDK